MRDRSIHTGRAIVLAQKLCDTICNDEELTQAAHWYALSELPEGFRVQAPQESEDPMEKLVYDTYWSKIGEFESQVVTITANMLSGLCLLRDKPESK